MTEADALAPRPKRRWNKAAWTKQFYLWHWVSSAIALVGMLLFAVTGITLNHAADIPGKATVTRHEAVVPAELLAEVAFQDGEADRKAPLPEAVCAWLDKALHASTRGKEAEWSEEEIYLSLPRPGGDAWLTIDRETGGAVHEITRRGAISYLNDLHKGRHTGMVWKGFLDVFSVACVVFCLTGLALLWVHGRRRPSTWPIVFAGLLLPLILILLFVH